MNHHFRFEWIDLIWLSLLILLAAVMIDFAWIGFLGSDDRHYAGAALKWLESPPYIGKTHWALRHTLVIPIAIALTVFGTTEFNIILPVLMGFFTILILSYCFLTKLFERRIAVIFGIIFSTTPIFLFSSTTAFPDILELLFIIASFWFFYTAVHSVKKYYWLFFSGIAAGLGFLTRETSVVLLFFYLVLFVFGYGIRRAYYWMMAVGFWAVLGAEWAFYGFTLGNIFYRAQVDLSVGAASRPIWNFTGFDSAGNLVAHPLVDPILMIAANQEFMLIFYIAIPGSIWLLSHNSVDKQVKLASILLVVLGVLWFLFIAVNSAVLFILPRYVLITTYMAVVITAFFVHQLGRIAGRKIAAAIVTMVIGANVLGVYVDNEKQFFPERTLIRLAEENSETIYTDPLTLIRANILLNIKGIRDRVRAVPPEDGALFVHVPRNVSTYHDYHKNFNTKVYTPTAAWAEVARADPGRKHSGVLIEWLGVGRFFPPQILRRLDRPEPPVSIYRVRS